MTNSFPTRRSSDLLGHGIQILLKRLLIRIERIPDEPAPFPARIAGQPRSGRAALGEGVEIGNPLDLSVQPIGPVMVHAAEVLRVRSEEHTSELQSLMRISYAVFCLKKTKNT